jgi:hypothetical protein
MINELWKSGSMRCLNKKDIDGKDYDLSFYGADMTVDHRRLELIFETCLTKEHAKRGNHSSNGECKLKKGMNSTEKAKVKDALFKKMEISELIMIFNTQKFEPSEYEKHSIVNESYAHSTLFKVNDGPQWQIHPLQGNRLEDESRLINLGEPEETTFFAILEPGENRPSMIKDFPEYYKFMSFNIHASRTLVVV